MSAFSRCSVGEFLKKDDNLFIAELCAQTAQLFTEFQSLAVISWQRTVPCLKRELGTLLRAIPDASEWGLLLEYDIPRREKRVDVVLLARQIVILLEFKTGASIDVAAARRQVEDYALDLRDFHRETFGKLLVPIIVGSSAAPFQPPCEFSINAFVSPALIANDETLCDAIAFSIERSGYATGAAQIDLQQWDQSAYEPVPGIIEAAQLLYAKHTVREITDALVEPPKIEATTKLIVRAIERARTEGRKVVCFVTGVPGAGKTLVGLNAVHSSDLVLDGLPRSVFLSGNRPLVKVISEALAKDHNRRTGDSLKESRRRVSTFVQSVHQFIKQYRATAETPHERILVFDEAQRAWNSEKVLRDLRKRASASARGQLTSARSEPAQILSLMDRFSDWAVIIALVGGGQEIHVGEAGLGAWGRALSEEFSNWEVWASPAAVDGEANLAGARLFPPGDPAIRRVHSEPWLHLDVSKRTRRSE
ncbi:MAG: DNA/RNA helicase domain-containing protein, partial [Rudaea sp.]